MFLNPQGNKLAKGLLEFAEGKAIGSNEAAFELAYTGQTVLATTKAQWTSELIGLRRTPTEYCR
jgi:DNA-directed RNA polymerase